MEKNNIKFLDSDAAKIHKHINFKEMKNKSILITGATGLVGLYFLLSLKKVYVKYNISITIIHNSKIDSILNNFFDFSKIKCIQADITDIDFLNDELSFYDYIIHSAGYGQPGKFLENKIKTIELNTTTTNFLIKCLTTNGKFLFISSSEVYSGLSSNQVETNVGTTNPSHNRACYIEGKICGETICNIHRESGRNIKVARLSLTYGPGTRSGDKRMLSNFIEKALVEKKIELIDSGDSTRTLLYVADSIIMMWNILFNSTDILYNVGGESTTKIYGLAKKVGANLDVKVIRPASDKKLKGSPEFVKINNSKYYKEFGKFQLESLESGIDKTIKWQKLLYGKK